MKKTNLLSYVSPSVRVAPFQMEYSFTLSAIVPGAGIDDAEEEEWTVS
jgi:hypothetical protein